MTKVKAKIEKEPRFNSLVEVLDNPKCQDLITGQLRKIETARVNALNNAGKGAKLRRGFYDNLVEKGLFNATGMTEQFKLIDQKKCDLPYTSREFITNLCLNAMQETIEYWQKIDSEEPKAKTKAKKETATNHHF